MNKKKTTYSLFTLFIVILFFSSIYYIYYMFPKIKASTRAMIFGSSDKSDYLHELRRMEFEKYDEEAGLELTEKYLEKYPNTKEALEYKGIFSSQVGKYEQAIVAYERYLELYGCDGSIYNNLGDACIRLNKNTLALYYLDKAEKVDGGKAIIYALSNKAKALEGLNRRNEAIEILKKAVYIHENVRVTDSIRTGHHIYLDALSNLGRLYDIKKDETMAKEMYEKAFAYDKKAISAFRDIMNMHFKNKEYSEADSIAADFLANCYEQDLDEAYKIIANGYEERKDYANAAKNYILSAEKSEEKAYCYLKAAKDYALLNDVENAKKYVDFCIKSDESFKKDIKYEPLLRGL